MKKVYMFMAFFVALSLSAQNYLMNANAKPYHAFAKGQISLNSPQAKGPLAQNFEGTFPPIGWSLPTGDADWAQSTDVNHTTGGANSAIFDCYNIALGDIGYLQTPEMVVTAGDVTFTFWCNYYLVAGTYGNASNLYVDKSINGGATWTPGTTDYLATITLDTWTQFTIDLTVNIGQNVTLRFKAISDYGSYNIAIDDIDGPAQNLPAHDLGVTAIAPTFVLSGNTVAPVVTITNFGASSETTYSVSLSDGVSYNQAVPVTTAIASLATYDVTFPNWTPADGNYTFTATVTVAGDVVAANDTMTVGCLVGPLLDAYTGNATAGTYNGINLTDGTTTGVGTIGSSPFPMAEEYDGTSIYRIYNNLTIGTVGGNGIYTQLGTMTGVSGTPTGIAYNWNTSVMYVVVLNASNLPQLCTLNMSTYALTLVGTGTVGMIIAMDFASDGFLYGPAIDNDNLYKIDPATGLTTLVGPVGIDLNYGQDVSYDRVDNLLYTITCGASYKFGTYNLTTGAFTEIADKGTDQYATLVITKIPSITATDILTFGFNALSPAVVGTVDAVNHTVALTVPYGTNVTALVPTITLSASATVAPLTGVAQNFTTPVTYTVTAQDGITTQAWTVTVTIAAASTATDILTFGFNALSPAVIGTVNPTAHTVALTVPYGTNVTALVPAITLSAGATVAPLTGVAQNFTTPVTYTVTAQDGITTQAWTVTVSIAVGVSDINASENANIYPIPANDIVNVKMNTTINQIDIININGQVLLQFVINNNEVALNTSKLINGIYFLRIVTSNGVMMKKILIAK